MKINSDNFYDLLKSGICRYWNENSLETMEIYIYHENRIEHDPKHVLNFIGIKKEGIIHLLRFGIYVNEVYKIELI